MDTFERACIDLQAGLREGYESLKHFWRAVRWLAIACLTVLGFRNTPVSAMSKDLTENTSVRLPMSILIAVISASASGGIVWGALNSEIKNLRDNQVIIDRRIEKAEDVIDKIVPLIERIDERTADIKAKLNSKG